MLNLNSYSEGKVMSIGFQSTGSPRTVGVMSTGEYTFTTRQREHLTVVSGQMSVKLQNRSEWHRYNEGESFIVDANQSFDVKVDVDTAYLCQYR